MKHYVLVVASALLLGGCISTSSTRIERSTAPSSLSGSRATGIHAIVVTHKEVPNATPDYLEKVAIRKARQACPRFYVQTKKFYSGQEATSAMLGIAGPWIELTIQCSQVSMNALEVLGVDRVRKASKGLQNEDYFDIHVQELRGEYTQVFHIVLRLLKEQGDPPFESNDVTGLIVTGRARHGALGFPRYEQYVVVVEPSEQGGARLVFRLLSYWPDFRDHGILKPSEREYVYRRSAWFVERVNSASVQLLSVP